MSLIGNVIKPSVKSVLIPLGLTAAASVTDAAIHKKMFGSGVTALIISNKEMNDITKMVQSLEDPSLLIKGNRETNKNKEKEQKGGFLRTLLDTLGASLLGNLWESRESREGTIRAGEDTIRADQDF